ncbi:MAG: hypothetical protein LBF56_00530 [Holosporales bacterium]|jgi:hypothetical protein|nr:hypothetical protein [Holosporales bacterium]
MTTTIAILKIESNSGTLLVSADARQEISPVTRHEIRRNINFEPISTNIPTKLRCTIETKDPPDLSELQLGALFKIYSIMRCRQNDISKQLDSYVEDSLETHEDHVAYRPIFNMFLTNFSCRDHSVNDPLWRFEFEEV